MGQVAGQGAQITLGGDERVKAKDFVGPDWKAVKVRSPGKDAGYLFSPFLWLQ